MAEKETSPSSAPQSKPEVPKKGKGKGPGKGPPPAKGAGKAKEASSPVPSWQKPEISAEWKPERMVNWQPIRQTDRIQGSVWQQVHDSLEGSAVQLPEDLLGRFMRKASEAPQKKASEPKKSSKRLLSSKQGLVADIHHALLIRKGVRTVYDLRWILGPTDSGASAQDDLADPLSEELLEALLGLLGAAAGEERSLTAAGQALKDGVQSEIFLRQILRSVPLQELQSRVQLNLDIARFPPKAADLESGLDLALTAAWSIIDSRAVPILLEGILLLGNSVNASSKNLGGAVGVTLDSLTKLAHTRCLPAKQAAGKGKKKSTRDESALEVLTWHLDEANEGFIKNLASDLDACHAAKDFDRSLMDGLVQDLANQTKQVQKYLETSSKVEAPATSPARLDGFLETASPHVTHLQDLLEEVDEATESLRQWFAEPPSSSLHDMLKALANLRDLLPQSGPVEKSPASRAHTYQQSETRKKRLEEKKVQKAAQKEAAALEAQKTQEDVEAPAPALDDAAKAEIDSNATVSEPAEPNDCEEAPDGGGVPEKGESKPAAALQTAPTSVLAQILSFRQGTVWISWVFDWEPILRQSGLSQEGSAKCFEILQFNEFEDGASLKPEQALQRWRCRGPPYKLDVPLGCHYIFAVRAVLLAASHCELDTDTPVLWASAVSSTVTVDLRYYSNCGPLKVVPAPATPADMVANGPPASGPPAVLEEKTPSPRRGRVASSMGDFIQSLQAGGAGSSPRPGRPSFCTDVSLKPPVVGSPTVAVTASKPMPVRIPPRQAAAAEESSAAPVQAPQPTSLVTPGEEASPCAISEPPGRESSHAIPPAEELEDVTSPQSLPSRASDSWASEASLSEFDDASLARLAQALRFLEGGAKPQPSIPAETCAGRLGIPRATSNSDQVHDSAEDISNHVQSEHFYDLQKPGSEGEAKASTGCKVPRAVSIFDNDETVANMAQALGGQGAEAISTPKSRPLLSRAASIFDDQDTLDSMAEMLSNVQSVDRSEPLGGGLKTGLSGDLLDGNEVLAAAERAFKKLQEKPCSACGGTGYVGLFGATGFGFFQSRCTSCQTSSPTSAS